MNWTVVFSLVLLGAIYFPTAFWLKGDYVPPRQGPAAVSDAGLIMKLERPFVAYGGHAFWAKVPGLERLSDTYDAPHRSPVLLYENDTLLGPAHATHEEIAKRGSGRFSHWGHGVVFSSKDGENPGPKGKTYWLVLQREATGRQGRPQESLPEPWASGRQP